MIEKNFSGLDGFVWWTGVVENRKDPLALGRCQVRIHGFHSDSLADIPTSDLPWALPVQSLNTHMFSTPKETDVVFGFFADGKNGQIPVIMGIIPGFETNVKNTGAGYHDLRSPQEIRYAPKYPVDRKYNTDGTGIKISEANTADPDVLESLRYPRDYDLNKQTITGVSRYQLSSNNVISSRKNNLDKDIVTATGIQWSEPYPAYNPLYPYNQSIETESGHVFELDDTPRNERISMNHRSGTYWEMYPSGSKVEKVTKSNYQIVMGDDFLHVMGHVFITVDSDAFIKVLGDVNLEAGNDLNAKVSGTMNLSVREALNIKASSLNMDIAGDASLITGGKQYFSSQGDINMITGSAFRSSAIGNMDLKSDGAFNATSKSGVNVLSGAATNIQGSSVNVIGGRVNINSGGSAAPATSASEGSATGIEQAAARSNKNNPPVSFESIKSPLPGNKFATVDATTGLAAKQDSFLQTNPNDPDGDKVPPEAPSGLVCNFDPNTHTFVPSSQWSIGSSGLNLIKKAEGYASTKAPPAIPAGSVHGYVDPASGGEPITIGYGTTGPAVDQTITTSTVITQSQAEEYLAYAINKKFMPMLKRYVKVDLTPNMVDACISLMYNIGAGNFGKSSIVTNINNKNWCAAGDGFLAWNKASGKVLDGLTKRRTAERTLFLT